MPRRSPGRGNVAARIDHLSKRRSARDDSGLWRDYLDTAAKFLGAPPSEERISILSSREDNLAVIVRRLEKVKPSVLDRWLPWLYENVEAGRREKIEVARRLDERTKENLRQGHRVLHQYTPDYERLDHEEWRELRHWIIATRPDLTDLPLWEAITDALDWSEHLAEVGGGGPLAEKLHDRLPEVVVELREKGAAWRTGGPIEVWMAIGRELGHCYKSRGTAEEYLDNDGDGVMYVLVGKDGKPRVTVSIKDCQVEIKGARNQLPMPRFHEAVTELFASPRHTWDLLAGCDPYEESADLRAMDIAVPTEALLLLAAQTRRKPYAEDLGPVLEETARWEEAGKKLADVQGAFPPAFWKYLKAVEEIAASLRDGPQWFAEVDQDPTTHHWVYRQHRLGERWDTYPLDVRSHKGFAKSVGKIPLGAGRAARGRAARAMSVGTIRATADDDGAPSWLVQTRGSKWPFEYQDRNKARAHLGTVVGWPRGEVEPIANGTLQGRPAPDVETRLLWRVCRDGKDTGLRIDLGFFAKWSPSNFGVVLKRGRKRLGHVVGTMRHVRSGQEWIDVGIVEKSHLAEELRGTGLGGLLYRAFAALLAAKKPDVRTAIAPTMWTLGTGTSFEAQAVWKRLLDAGATPVMPTQHGFSPLAGVGRINRGRGARVVAGLTLIAEGRSNYRTVIAGREVVAVKKPRGHWRWGVHPWPITVRFPTILGQGTSLTKALVNAQESAERADPRGPWAPGSQW